MEPGISKSDEEKVRHDKRAQLKALNVQHGEPTKALDSSLKRHTALIRRIRQSIGLDNRDQILNDIETLTLEKYIEEIAGAVPEGIVRCKLEKDVWSAAEVISALHRRFPTKFTPALVAALGSALVPSNKSALATMTADQREKEEAARVMRQRPILRVCAELALVNIIRDAPTRSGGEWIMKLMRELLSNDPSLSSLPLLTTFLKSYSRPFLGLVPPVASKQISASAEPGTLACGASDAPEVAFPPLGVEAEEDELVEKDIRDRFKKMCEGYFENVAKKLVIEHKRLQEQDRRNHEAYIRSGEIFEDRQQAYEKMTKSYEKLLTSSQTLSELLYLPMPTLPTSSSTGNSIQIGTNAGALLSDDAEEAAFAALGGKWEDEEERRFFEDIQDLREVVPKSILGIDDGRESVKENDGSDAEARKNAEDEEVRRLQEELAGLEAPGGALQVNGKADSEEEAPGEEEDGAATPTPSTPKEGSRPTTPTLAPQGPSQLLTALLARLPDCTNRTLIDQAAVEFAFLNSKAARKRLVRFLTQVPKTRTDLLPHYSRLVATINRYMPDIGVELVAALDEEFRYLQRKKNVMVELAEVRLKNITFISNLTKFKVVPPHLILHMFKVCIDDFSGTNVDNLALLLEGCGRFLLRNEETKQRFGTMLELMKRKQGLLHLDQRQTMLLENAYYQANPPERAPRQEKERTPIELFIRHLLYDILTKRTIDKVLKLLRKLDWEDPHTHRVLHKVFTKPHKLRYGNIALLAMLTYDLQRYHPEFSIAVVDQVLEDIRRGLEQNMYSANQRRVAAVKYLGELYIYRLISSGLIFDTLWALVTFGHPKGHPLPQFPCPIDMSDDFFRIRLVGVLLDTCGMCFDRGSQKRKLDNFLVFFQYYLLCKEPMPMDVDFMVTDSLEAIRPKLVLLKNIEDAANAVDEMFASTVQGPGSGVGEGSGDDSGDDGERPTKDEDEDEDEEDATTIDSPIDERGPSPEPTLVVTSSQETIGPNEEEDAEFAKELAKLVTDTSTESRKVDRRTAQTLWESAVLPPGMRKRHEEGEGSTENANPGIMNFTMLTKRGNKQQVRQLAIPSESTLAIQTRSAQEQDKVEQQHLKRLVLDYEQREEAEEIKALEAKNRPIKIRLAG
ncbi:ARM repeat-containing protein [Multifurca ochricompacta]|uniref:ARM repeat-containing protein n=1 Tax=Multifurca ochricompacta TaxID=376703 RepID=A0AAD4LXK0_9AGAM|nr:ARM repeat-containing protein [Multifurca ochricompacta]